MGRPVRSVCASSYEPLEVRREVLLRKGGG
jgi:hypothetical protein